MDYFTIRYAVSFVLFLSIFPCVFAIAVPADTSQPSDTPAVHGAQLPESLHTYLKTELPAFHPVTEKDFVAGSFDGNREQLSTSLPWLAQADFDGNGMDDFALLMLGIKDGKRHVSLVTARAGENGWTHEVLHSYTWDRAVPDKLDLEPAGPVFMGYDENGQERTETLAYPSVTMGGLKQCPAHRYCWKDGAWRDAYIRL